jgi:hypothetical protein
LRSDGAAALDAVGAAWTMLRLRGLVDDAGYPLACPNDDRYRLWMVDREGPPVSGKSTEVRVELAGTDLERLVVVGGDLEYLMDLPCDRLLSHTEVRLVAGILRRLLVDGQ